MAKRLVFWLIVYLCACVCAVLILSYTAWLYTATEIVLGGW